MPAARPMPVRFWEKVSKSNGCWIFSASPNRENGYGRIWFNRKHHFAHRISYEMHFGKIPKDKLVLHKCDNPPCVNPDHLFLGTDKDNTHDCIAKGRFRGFTVGWNKTRKRKQVRDRTLKKE